MTPDFYAMLQEPRRPWLEVEALKNRFVRFSAEVHPDRFHQASPSEKDAATRQYASLNAAYTALREPKDRLLHLLELETGGQPRDIQRIPPGTVDLFVEVGQKCRDVDTFVAQRAKISSPLLKVQQFQAAQEWLDGLIQLQHKVNTKRDELFEELKSLNPQWEAADRLPREERAKSLSLDRLEQAYRALSYVARWTEQLQQRIVELSV